MNPLSLAPLTVLPVSPLEQIDAAHAAGFEFTGLRLNRVVASDVDIIGNAGLRREIRTRLADTGVRMLDIEVFRLGPDVDVRAMLPAIEYGAELGARYMLCTRLDGVPTDDDTARTAQKLAELCALCEPYRVRPMLEFMVYRKMRTVGDARRLIELAGDPDAGICVDALHLDRSGGVPGDLRSMPPALFDYVQLCDAPATRPSDADIPLEARSGRLYPGDGALPLRELLEALPAGIPLSLEAPSQRHAVLSVTERASLIAAKTRRLFDGGDAST